MISSAIKLNDEPRNRLSERGSDRRDTRRPVALSEVATLAKVPWQQVAAVIEVFRQEGRSFLTPPVGKELEPESVVDISHESLIRQWQRLQDWTTQEAEAAEREGKTLSAYARERGISRHTLYAAREMVRVARPGAVVAASVWDFAGGLPSTRMLADIAAALDPDSSLIRSYLGKSYFDERRDRSSAEELAIAKALDPLDPTPWFYDAIRKQTVNRPVEALIDLQRDDQASATINIALGLAPNDFDVLRDYGYILESLGDYEGAAVQYESALALEPNLPFMKMDLDRAYRQIGRYNEALDLLFDVDSQSPDNALNTFRFRVPKVYLGGAHIRANHKLVIRIP